MASIASGSSGSDEIVDIDFGPGFEPSNDWAKDSENLEPDSAIEWIQGGNGEEVAFEVPKKSLTYGDFKFRSKHLLDIDGATSQLHAKRFVQECKSIGRKQFSSIRGSLCYMVESFYGHNCRVIDRRVMFGDKNDSPYKLFFNLSDIIELTQMSLCKDIVLSLVSWSPFTYLAETMLTTAFFVDVVGVILRAVTSLSQMLDVCIFACVKDFDNDDQLLAHLAGKLAFFDNEDPNNWSLDRRFRDIKDCMTNHRSVIRNKLLKFGSVLSKAQELSNWYIKGKGEQPEMSGFRKYVVIPSNLRAGGLDPKVKEVIDALYVTTYSAKHMAYAPEDRRAKVAKVIKENFSEGNITTGGTGRDSGVANFYAFLQCQVRDGRITEVLESCIRGEITHLLSGTGSMKTESEIRNTIIAVATVLEKYDQCRAYYTFGIAASEKSSLTDLQHALCILKGLIAQIIVLEELDLDYVPEIVNRPIKDVLKEAGHSLKDGTVVMTFKPDYIEIDNHVLKIIEVSLCNDVAGKKAQHKSEKQEIERCKPRNIEIDFQSYVFSNQEFNVRFQEHVLFAQLQRVRKALRYLHTFPDLDVEMAIRSVLSATQIRTRKFRDTSLRCSEENLREFVLHHKDENEVLPLYANALYALDEFASWNIDELHALIDDYVMRSMSLVSQDSGPFSATDLEVGIERVQAKIEEHTLPEEEPFEFEPVHQYPMVQRSWDLKEKKIMFNLDVSPWFAKMHNLEAKFASDGLMMSRDLQNQVNLLYSWIALKHKLHFYIGKDKNLRVIRGLDNTDYKESSYTTDIQKKVDNKELMSLFEEMKVEEDFEDMSHLNSIVSNRIHAMKPYLPLTQLEYSKFVMSSKGNEVKKKNGKYNEESCKKVEETIEYLMKNSQRDYTSSLINEHSFEALKIKQKASNMGPMATSMIKNIIDSVKPLKSFEQACFCSILAKLFFRCVEGRVAGDFSLATDMESGITLMISAVKKREVGFSYNCCVITNNTVFTSMYIGKPKNTGHGCVSHVFQMGVREAKLLEACWMRYIMFAAHKACIAKKEKELVEHTIQFSEEDKRSFSVMMVFLMRNKKVPEQALIQGNRYFMEYLVSCCCDNNEIIEKVTTERHNIMTFWMLKQYEKALKYAEENQRENQQSMIDKTYDFKLIDGLTGATVSNMDELVSSAYLIHWTSNIELSNPRTAASEIMQEFSKHSVANSKCKKFEPSFSLGFGTKKNGMTTKEIRKGTGHDTEFIALMTYAHALEIDMSSMIITPTSAQNSILGLTNTTAIITQKAGKLDLKTILNSFEVARVRTLISKIKDHNKARWRLKEKTKKTKLETIPEDEEGEEDERRKEDAFDWVKGMYGGVYDKVQKTMNTSDCLPLKTIADLRADTVDERARVIAHVKRTMDPGLPPNGFVDKFKELRDIASKRSPTFEGELDSMDDFLAKLENLAETSADLYTYSCQKIREALPPDPKLARETWRKQDIDEYVAKNLTEDGAKFFSEEDLSITEAFLDELPSDVVYFLACVNVTQMVRPDSSIKGTLEQLSQMIAKTKACTCTPEELALDEVQRIVVYQNKKFNTILKKSKGPKKLFPTSVSSKVVLVFSSLVTASVSRTDVLRLANTYNRTLEGFYFKPAPKMQYGAIRGIYIQFEHDKIVNFAFEQEAHAMCKSLENETLHNKAVKDVIANQSIQRISQVTSCEWAADHSAWGPTMMAISLGVVKSVYKKVKGLDEETQFFDLKVGLRSLMARIEIPRLCLSSYFNRKLNLERSASEVKTEFAENMTDANEKILKDVLQKGESSTVYKGGFIPGINHFASSLLGSTVHAELCTSLMRIFPKLSDELAEKMNNENSFPIEGLEDGIYWFPMEKPYNNPKFFAKKDAIIDHVNNIGVSKVKDEIDPFFPQRFFKKFEVNDAEKVHKFSLPVHLSTCFEGPKGVFKREWSHGSKEVKRWFGGRVALNQYQGSDDEALSEVTYWVDSDGNCEVFFDSQLYAWVFNIYKVTSKLSGQTTSPKSLGMMGCGEFNSRWTTTREIIPAEKKYTRSLEVKPFIGPVEMFNGQVSFMQDQMTDGCPYWMSVLHMFLCYQRIYKYFLKVDKVDLCLLPPQVGGIPSGNMAVIYDKSDTGRLKFETQISRICLGDKLSEQLLDWVFVHTSDVTPIRDYGEKVLKETKLNLVFTYKLSKELAGFSEQIKHIKEELNAPDFPFGMNTLIRDLDPGSHESELLKLERILSSPSIKRGQVSSPYGIWNLHSSSFKGKRVFSSDARVKSYTDINNNAIETPKGFRFNLLSLMKAMISGEGDSKYVSFEEVCISTTADLADLRSWRFVGFMAEKEELNLVKTKIITSPKSISEVQDPELAILWYLYPDEASRHFPDTIKSSCLSSDLVTITALYSKELDELKAMLKEMEKPTTAEGEQDGGEAGDEPTAEGQGEEGEGVTEGEFQERSDMLEERFLHKLENLKMKLKKTGGTSQTIRYLGAEFEDPGERLQSILKNVFFSRYTIETEVASLPFVEREGVTSSSKVDILLDCLHKVELEKRSEFLKIAKLHPDINEAITKLSLQPSTAMNMFKLLLLEEHKTDMVRGLSNKYSLNAGDISSSYQKLGPVTIIESYRHPDWLTVLMAGGRTTIFTSTKDKEVASLLLKVCLSTGKNTFDAEDLFVAASKLDNYPESKIAVNYALGMLTCTEVESGGNIRESKFRMLKSSQFSRVGKNEVLISYKSVAEGYELLGRVSGMIDNQEVGNVTKRLLFLRAKQLSFKILDPLACSLMSLCGDELQVYDEKSDYDAEVTEASKEFEDCIKTGMSLIETIMFLQTVTNDNSVIKEVVSRYKGHGPALQHNLEAGIAQIDARQEVREEVITFPCFSYLIGRGCSRQDATLMFGNLHLTTHKVPGALRIMAPTEIGKKDPFWNDIILNGEPYYLRGQKKSRNKKNWKHLESVVCRVGQLLAFVRDGFVSCTGDYKVMYALLAEALRPLPVPIDVLVNERFEVVISFLPTAIMIQDFTNCSEE